MKSLFLTGLLVDTPHTVLVGHAIDTVNASSSFFLPFVLFSLYTRVPFSSILSFPTTASMPTSTVLLHFFFLFVPLDIVTRHMRIVFLRFTHWPLCSPRRHKNRIDILISPSPHSIRVCRTCCPVPLLQWIC